jgi:hypothetical protein
LYPTHSAFKKIASPFWEFGWVNVIVALSLILAFHEFLEPTLCKPGTIPSPESDSILKNNLA